jgi:hypothetical protein
MLSEELQRPEQQQAALALGGRGSPRPESYPLRLALTGAASHLERLQLMFPTGELACWCGLLPGLAHSSSEGLLIDAGSVKLARRCSRALRADAVFGRWTLLVAIDRDELPLLEGSLEVDDFVLRPLDLEEVRARLRRARRRQGDTLPAPGAPSIDLAAREVRWGGRSVPLAARELALLQCLRRHEGSVISREELIVGAWGHSYRGSTRTVDTHISRLRIKLAGLLRIDTIRTTGYRPFFSNC